MKGRKNLNLNSLHIMTKIISFLPGACYSLNVMKTAKQFNKAQVSVGKKRKELKFRIQD